MQVVAILAIIFAAQCHASPDDFVTIWMPRTMTTGHSVRSSIVWAYDDPGLQTQVAIKLGKASRTVSLIPDKLSNVVFERTGSGSKKSVKGTLTMYRKERNVDKCVTASLNVEVNDNKFYAFIQTDKPIYKPNDNVRFRVIVVDMDLKPYHMNNIVAEIIDPHGTVVRNFTDLKEGRHLGVFNETFSLERNTPLGNWKIRVMVNKQKNKLVHKLFNVQKYAFPLFNVKVNFDSYVSYGRSVNITFSAEYPFGGIVSGIATAFIQNIDEKVLFQKTFYNITCSQSFTVNTMENLQLDGQKPSKLFVVVSFTDSESQITVNGTTKELNVITDDRYQMIVEHSKAFMPGHSFPIVVKLFDWKKSTNIKHFEYVHITCKFGLKNEDPQTVQYNLFPYEKQNIAEKNIIVPLNATSFDITAKYINSEIYRRSIEMGNVTLGIGHLYVTHRPVNPQHGDSVYIRASSMSDEINECVYDVMTRYGRIDSQKVKCGDICEFEIKINERMMPQATVTVYYVKDKGNVMQGSTVIKTSLSKAKLNMTLTKDNEIISSPVKTKDRINLSFDSKSQTKSSIFYIAYDKRLTSFNIPNDLNKKDVVDKVANYDGYNQIIVLDMKKSHECTDDELSRIREGESVVAQQQSGDSFGAIDDIFDTTDDLTDSNSIEEENEIGSVEGELLREYFPEVWLFDKGSTNNNGQLNMNIKVPDVMTTWVFNAFSFDSVKGLAIANPLELKVQNEFFIVMNLPYSIRFKEVFALDLIVFNYKGTQQDAFVELKKFNDDDFDFVTTKDECTFISNSNSISTSSTKTIPNLGSKKFTFFIQSHKQHKNAAKIMKIRLEAIAKVSNDEDRVKRNLTIEPVGVYQNQYEHYSNYCNGSCGGSFSVLPDINNDLLRYTNQWFIAGGNYLKTAPSHDKFANHPQDCLQQATSRMKGDAERYRFLKSENFSVSKEDELFSKNLQTIIDKSHYPYRSHTGYRAHLVDALGTAISVGGLPKDDSKIEMMKTEFTEIIKQQQDNGLFSNFGSIPDYSCPYAQTAYILIQFLNHKSLVNEAYEEQINKGFKYLNGSISIKGLSISIVAYAFALRGLPVENFINYIEKNNVDSDPNQKHNKCMRINKEDQKCDPWFTAYTAMTYFAMKEYTKAMSLVNWLVTNHIKSFYSANSFTYSVLTEPIAKIAKFGKVKTTSLTIIAENELNVKTRAEFKFTAVNSSTEQFKEFPGQSNKISYHGKGVGFFAVTRVVEKLHIAPQTQSLFNISTIISKGSITVCGMYKDEAGDKKDLNNVIYEVDMPSGYTYLKIDNTNRANNHLADIQTTPMKNRVILYFVDFAPKIDYCAKIEMQKNYSVNNLQDSGIKIYDYDKKDMVSIFFYNINKCNGFYHHNK